MVHPYFVRKQVLLSLQVILFAVCFIYALFSVKRLSEDGVRDNHIGSNEHDTINVINVQKKSANGTETVISERKTANGMLGRSLNIHRWDSLCGFMTDELRMSVFFPNLPNWRSSIDSLKFSSDTANFGQRIFGYIHPPLTGFYQFAISSDDFSELWLSSDSDPSNATLVCYVGKSMNGNASFEWTQPGEFSKYKSQKSRKIRLMKGEKYFIEILHKQAIGLGHFHVIWKLPASEKFVNISSRFLSQYMEEHDATPESRPLRQHKTPAKLTGIADQHKQFDNLFVKNKNSHYLSHYHKRLSNCTIPKMNKKLRRYQGILFVHTAQVFPDDGSNYILKICQEFRHYDECFGNSLLDEKEASRIIDEYVDTTLPKSYSLASTIRLEKFTRPTSKVSHYQYYFIDVEVIDKTTGKLSRIAEPVWKRSNDGKLCNPARRSWKPDVMVYVIVTAKNQDFWVHNFIDTIEYIQEENNDYNIHPIIVDFGSEDVGPNDTEIYLKRSKLKHYTVIHRDGIFYKTAAINEAAASVEDENSILFQLDLHLDLPLNLIDTVRKHTIQGAVAFVPILMRLMCGSTPAIPIGHWEDQGYGLFAVYKSDWIKFGGMNENEFKENWGGEDWEMIDRVIMSDIKVQSLKMPGLFHHYHSKKRMWQNAG